MGQEEVKKNVIEVICIGGDKRRSTYANILLATYSSSQWFPNASIITILKYTLLLFNHKFTKALSGMTSSLTSTNTYTLFVSPFIKSCVSSALLFSLDPLA